METRTFTEEQIRSIMYEEGIYDTKNEIKLYTIVSEKIIDSDQSKNSTQHEYVIKEISSGKYFKAVLGDSPWIKQDMVNAKQIWHEVKPTTRTIIEYN